MKEKKTKIKKLANKIKEDGSGNKARGITLISLIITVVVLIILATVVINLSLGDKGIFNRAREAKEKYQNAEGQEQTEIAKVTNEIDNYVIGTRGISKKDILFNGHCKYGIKF